MSADSDWYGLAMCWVMEWLEAWPCTKFSGNDLWEQGLPVPPSSNRRNLSVVLRELEKRGDIERTGQSEPSLGGHLASTILVYRRCV